MADQLLLLLCWLQGDLGLNICEAHAFNTRDQFSLDVFVVNGWTGGATEELEDVLSRRLQELPPPIVRGSSNVSASPSDGRPPPEQRVPVEEVAELAHVGLGFGPWALLACWRSAVLDVTLALRLSWLASWVLLLASWLTLLPHCLPSQQQASTSACDNDWELDPNDITFHEKIASGAFGDLFRGSYCGQDVAIKILRNVHDDTQQFQEFLQEVAIMRKVRHRNVVQFIGACTQKPNLCIVFEYMSGGSVYDYIRRAGPLRVSTVLKVALEVCRGMDYLHKRKIVHRDLKAANLLLDDTGTVKIADFGVARVMDHTGIMTAETGTYRWVGGHGLRALMGCWAGQLQAALTTGPAMSASMAPRAGRSCYRGNAGCSCCCSVTALPFKRAGWLCGLSCRSG